jgi:DNA-directed RNA polymerase subunit beta
LSYKVVKYGKGRERRNYSRVKVNVDLPDLIEVQTKSFEWFLDQGLKELFRDISPIVNFTENIELYFEDYILDEPKYDINQCKNKELTYSKPLRVHVKLVNKETGEIKEQKIFMGDMSMMTPWGSFIINGSERVIVNQIVRSPGVFFSENIDKKTLKSRYLGQVIPSRGAWIEFETGTKDAFYAKLDRSKKIPLTTLLRAIGISNDEEIISLFGQSRMMELTFDKDITVDSESAILEVYSKLRQGEKATLEGAVGFLESRLFDQRRYDLASVGRFKFNNKLNVLNRAFNQILATDIINPETGEIVVAEGTELTQDIIELLDQNRSWFRYRIPGVGATKLEYPFFGAMDLLRAVEFEGAKVFDFMSDQDLLDMIRAQSFGAAEDHALNYLKFEYRSRSIKERYEEIFNSVQTFDSKALRETLESFTYNNVSLFPNLLDLNDQELQEQIKNIKTADRDIFLDAYSNKYFQVHYDNIKSISDYVKSLPELFSTQEILEDIRTYEFDEHPLFTFLDDEELIDFIQNREFPSVDDLVKRYINFTQNSVEHFTDMYGEEYVEDLREMLQDVITDDKTASSLEFYLMDAKNQMYKGTGLFAGLSDDDIVMLIQMDHSKFDSFLEGITPKTFTDLQYVLGQTQSLKIKDVINEAVMDDRLKLSHVDFMESLNNEMFDGHSLFVFNYLDEEETKTESYEMVLSYFEHGTPLKYNVLVRDYIDRYGMSSEESNEQSDQTYIDYYVERYGEAQYKALLNLIEEAFSLDEIYYEQAQVEIIDVFAKGEDGNEFVLKLIGNNQDETREFIVPSDIIASTSYYISLYNGVGTMDDIDHLGNRRLRLIGELLKNQFRIGLTKMEKNVKDRMSTKEPDEITPQKLINIRPLTSSMKEFFGSSQLSQFMAQTNPLDEITHKRRISALGPGGLTRDRAGFEVRDVHHSHYGRICPIETPEGQNIGLINSLASYVKVNEYGFMETPYLKVIHNGDKSVISDEIDFLSAHDEENFVIAQGNARVNDKKELIDHNVVARHQGETKLFPNDRIDYMDVSPKQIVSISTASIPFLEHDDANRALMGANMQRQAIPLLIPEAPYVGTGIEYKAAHDSGSCLLSEVAGEVVYVDANVIHIKTEDGKVVEHVLSKFQRSNQGTLLNMKPIVKKGDMVEYRETIADGPSMDKGEMALGRNLTVAFMTWNGYNYEDAIIMSERLVKEDILTSIHIEKHDIDARDTKLGKEEITREIPGVSPEMVKYLDENGIIIPGAEVKEDDILVGKVTPKGHTDPSAADKLLLAIFGEKSREVRDTSLKVKHGEGGIVQSVKHFSRANGDELPPGVNEKVYVYIVQKRKINEGDKMAGRHGNKGVISKILPEEDMPYMEDGTPIDIMLNPLGVPSRMNIGQVLEIHLGMAAKRLGLHVATPVFDGVNNDDLKAIMDEAGMRPDGKQTLYSGRTGRPYDHPISVGVMYMIKLDHMVDDKLHARSVGPYTLVTQQPMGGKAQNGGQRFGEMEVWALEAYGAAYALQEMLTVKSDDIVGRNKVFKAITSGQPIPGPSLPESFRVLSRELQSLGIYVELISRDSGENEAAQSIVDDHLEENNSKFRFDA